MKEELHAAIIRTGQMLRSAEGEKDLQPLASVLKTHLDGLINIAIGQLEREMEGFVDSPVTYSLPPEIVETVTAGENTKSQLPQDNQEAFAKAVEYADQWREWKGVIKDKPRGEVEVRFKCGQVWPGSAEKCIWELGEESSVSDDFQIIAWRPNHSSAS